MADGFAVPVETVMRPLLDPHDVRVLVGDEERHQHRWISWCIFRGLLRRLVGSLGAVDQAGHTTWGRQQDLSSNSFLK